MHTMNVNIMNIMNNGDNSQNYRKKKITRKITKLQNKHRIFAHVNNNCGTTPRRLRDNSCKIRSQTN